MSYNSHPAAPDCTLAHCLGSTAHTFIVGLCFIALINPLWAAVSGRRSDIITAHYTLSAEQPADRVIMFSCADSKQLKLSGSFKRRLCLFLWKTCETSMTSTLLSTVSNWWELLGCWNTCTKQVFQHLSAVFQHFSEEARSKFEAGQKTRKTDAIVVMVLVSSSWCDV